MIVCSCGRKIKIKDGIKSQTINIYTRGLIHGEYEYIIRIWGINNFASGKEIEDKNFSNLNDLFDFLKNNHYGIMEKSSQNYSNNTISNSNSSHKTRTNSNFSKDSWVHKALPKSEEIINNFLNNFIKLPYLHRVEHSIHCDLYNLFQKDDLFNKDVKLLDGTKTQILHKEWPEFTPREDKDNRRGNFDFAILSPESIRDKGIFDFTNGRIEAPIVVEVGLNYGEKHLLGDFKKLNNSKVYRGYLLHLVRKEKVDDNSIEEILSEIESKFKNIKVGYVKHDVNGVRYKLIKDKGIKINSL